MLAAKKKLMLVSASSCTVEERKSLTGKATWKRVKREVEVQVGCGCGIAGQFTSIQRVLRPCNQGTGSLDGSGKLGVYCSWVCSVHCRLFTWYRKRPPTKN